MRIIIKILFTLYCLATLSFFQPFNILSPQLVKALTYIILALLLAFTILFTKNNHSGRFRKPLTYLLILFGLSCFIPTICNFGQSITDSILITIPYFSYALYFTLSRNCIDKKFLYRLVFTISILTILTHIINLITFPIIIFGTPESEYDLERGGIRIVMDGIMFVILSFFISIEKWSRTKKYKWLIFAIICYTSVFLSYTRQYILVCTVLGIIMMTHKLNIIKRILIIGICAVTIMMVAPRIPTVNKLLEITIKQQEQAEMYDREDIRITAARFYGYENFPYTINRFFGNGVPTAHSAWGRDFLLYTESEHLFAADVGIFGFNWQFGLLSVLCLLSIFFKAIISKKQTDNIGRYYCLALFICSFASGSLLYPFGIIVTTIALYLIDISQNKPNVQ